MSYKTDYFKSPHALAHTDTAQPVLVALSGGADSCCLLHLMHDYARQTGCKICAAHVNHNIRTEQYGNEAARDEAFCRKLCHDLGVELFVLDADVPAIAKASGESMETAARRVRYGFFTDVMKQQGIKILATAHNADDNLETQIFNLCRGCGVDGMCGIPRQRPFPEADGIIVRPILDAAKCDILDFCRKNGIEYVTDSTNLQNDCTRNRIRHHIVPELVSLFGTPQRAAMRLGSNAECDVDFINSFALDFLTSNGGRLPLDRLVALHPAVLTRVLALSFKEKYDATLEYVHISALAKLINEQKSQSSVSLPANIRAVISQGEMIFEADTRDDTQKPKKYDIALKYGLNFIDGTDFALVLTQSGCGEYPDIDNYEKSAEATLYCTENGDFSARSRCEGDTVLDGGMHKRIKKLMCDKKVDVRYRDTLPLVCADGEIAYVPLCAVADTFKKQKNKQKIKISIYKKYGEH